MFMIVERLKIPDVIVPELERFGVFAGGNARVALAGGSFADRGGEEGHLAKPALVEQLVRRQALGSCEVQQPIPYVHLSFRELGKERQNQAEASTVADTRIAQDAGPPATECLALDLEKLGEKLIA